MTIKPIETHYAGCVFRSRLEARWAVFFDRLRITWAYEPEGYETPHGRYLPDFSITLPDGQAVWFEVKPPVVMLDPRWQHVAEIQPFYVAFGMPMHSGDWPGFYRVQPNGGWARTSLTFTPDMTSLTFAYDAARGARFDGAKPTTEAWSPAMMDAICHVECTGCGEVIMICSTCPRCGRLDR